METRLSRTTIYDVRPSATPHELALVGLAMLWEPNAGKHMTMMRLGFRGVLIVLLIAAAIVYLAVGFGPEIRLIEQLLREFW
jgi:hypothetical protein